VRSLPHRFVLLHSKVEEGSMEAVTKDKAMEDLRTRTQQVEELVDPPGKESADTFTAARARTKASLRDTYAGLSEMSSELRRQAYAAGRDADRYVHHKPWQALGAVLGIGLFLGYLLGRH